MGYKMWRTQCVLALVALYLGLVHSWSGSWDFATASSRQLDFYTGGTKTHSEDVTFSDMGVLSISTIAYDTVYNRLFFTDLVNKNALILSCDIATMEIKSVVPRTDDRERVQGIAFDPVQELLFLIILSKPFIYSLSLKPGSENNEYERVITLEKGETPFHIAVDSCKGYIYWAGLDGNRSDYLSTIERARFDGSEREIIIGDTDIHSPYSLFIDQQTQKLFWSYKKLAQITIESANMNGQNRTILYNETANDFPITVAVTKDSIYFAHIFERIVKQIPKNSEMHATPKVFSMQEWGDIFSNYKIEDQIQGIEDCEPLKSLLTKLNVSVTKDNVSSNISTLGTKVNGSDNCKCAPGYTGKRYDISVCQNYCFQGDCTANAEGQPICRCYGGYSGKRCEVNQCQGYCLNNGVCSLNEKSEPICQCKGDYEGDRCDVSVCLNRLNKCIQTVSMLRNILNADVAPVGSDNAAKSTCASTIF